VSQVEIHILQPGRPERRMTLQDGVVFVGRSEDNEVVLADVGVSRRHARIEVGAGAVVVEDLGSGNGTWYRGQSVRRQVLGDGDEVAIDPFTLRVRVAGSSETVEITTGRDETIPLKGAGPPAMLTVTSAHRMPVRIFPLPLSGALTLGRSDRNAIVLPEPASSRVHAEVQCVEGMCTLRDNGSSNGTFVNGRRVKERVLEDGDRIRIGTVELRFSRVIEGEGTEGFSAPIVVAAEARPLPPPPPPPPATAAFPAPLAPASPAPARPAPVPPPAPTVVPAGRAEEIQVNPARAGGKRLPSGGRRKSTGFFSRPINQVSMGVLAITFVMVGGKVASDVLVGLLEARRASESVESGAAGTSTAPAPVAGSPAPAPAPSGAGSASPTAAPATTDPIMAEGMRHFAEGRYFDAAGAFYRVLQIDPNHVDARRMGYVACEFITLGEVRSSLLARTTSEAARAAARAAALDAVARAVAGTLPVADARQPLADALALSPDDPELRAAEVTLAERQSSVARAVSAGRAAAASRDLDERLAAAQADLARGKLSKAVRGFEEVMAADPGKVSPQYHTAQEGVREAKDKMKADSKAAWTEANSALKSGNYVSARKLLKEVVAIDPYNEAAVARLAETRATLKEQASDFYKEARTLEGLGQNEKAIALYHKVQLYVDDDADPLSQKAQARTEALLR
jgi:pSer/pThr/pTyr-binding forkhead associated (FHA) protein/tetratricopeptide (TPR) repeat protein